jgi:hypothetical protein
MGISGISLRILKDSNCLGLMLFGAGLLQAGSITFTDTTFNPSNYSITTFQSAGETVNVSQTLTGGNPGAAMQINTTVPAGSTIALEYFLNSMFVYNPATQGAIGSINLSQDVNMQSGGGVQAESAAFLISQGGNLYFLNIPVTANAGVWETASMSGTQASNWDLITNVSTLATNTAEHPNFSSGPLQFGFVTGWISSSSFDYSSIQLVDNLSITVNAEPTPEPATLLLFGAGLAGISVGFIRRRKREPL